MTSQRHYYGEYYLVKVGQPHHFVLFGGALELDDALAVVLNREELALVTNARLLIDLDLKQQFQLEIITAFKVGNFLKFFRIFFFHVSQLYVHCVYVPYFSEMCEGMV